MIKNLIFFLLFSSSGLSFAGVCDSWNNHPEQRDYLLSLEVSSGDLDAVKELFTCGATIKDVDRLSLLITATENSYIVTKFLLANGADVNSDKKDGIRHNLLLKSLLNINGVPNDWVLIAIDLINKGIAFDHVQNVLNYSMSISAEQTPSLVEAILARGVNPNKPDKGDTRLPLSVLSRQYGSAEFYFRHHHGRYPTVDEKKKLYDNYRKIALSLLNAGANPDLDGTVLTDFFKSWDSNSFKNLLYFQPDPNIQVMAEGQLVTAFDYILTSVEDRMCWDEWLEKVELLLKNGATPKNFNPKYYSCQKLKALLSTYKAI